MTEDGASALSALWIIVEGPDGAGKSSIARQVAHLLASGGGSAPDRPCVLQKLSYDSPPYDYFAKPLRTRQAWPGEAHVVQDRSAMSTLVYEPIIRKDHERLTRFENICMMQAQTPYIALVHVTAAVYVLEERVGARGDDYIQREQLKEILEGYEREVRSWEGLGGRVTTIDTTWHFPSDTELLLELSLMRAAR